MPETQSLTAQELADELADRGVSLDLALDAIGLRLEQDPDAAAIISGWMLRMMNGVSPVPYGPGGDV